MPEGSKGPSLITMNSLTFLKDLVTASESTKDILLHVLPHLPPYSVRSLALVKRSSYQFICGPETLEYWRRRFLEEWDDAEWLSKCGAHTYRSEYLRRQDALLKIMSNNNITSDDRCVRKRWEKVWDTLYEIVADHKQKNVQVLIENGLMSALRGSEGHTLAQKSARESGKLGDACNAQCLFEVYIRILKTMLVALMRLVREQCATNWVDDRQEAQKELVEMLETARHLKKKIALLAKDRTLATSFAIEWQSLDAGLDWATRVSMLANGRRVLTGGGVEFSAPSFVPAYFPVRQRFSNVDVSSLMRIFTGRWCGSYLFAESSGFGRRVDGPMTMNIDCERDPGSPSTKLRIQGTGQDDIDAFKIDGVALVRDLKEDHNRSSCRPSRAGERVIVITFVKTYSTHNFLYRGILIAGGIVGTWGPRPNGSFVLWPAEPIINVRQST